MCEVSEGASSAPRSLCEATQKNKEANKRSDIADTSEMEIFA